MSVSKPLCFCGLHVTTASLFHSFSPRLWFIHTFHGNISFSFTLNDTCLGCISTVLSHLLWIWCLDPLPILPLDCSWTYLPCHCPTLQPFKIHLQPPAIGKSYLGFQRSSTALDSFGPVQSNTWKKQNKTKKRNICLLYTSNWKYDWKKSYK